MKKILSMRQMSEVNGGTNCFFVGLFPFSAPTTPSIIWKMTQVGYCWIS